MASATAKPQKRLGDFLKEQQEPFMLEVYLLEREYYSKRWSLNGDSGCNSSEKSASATSCGLNIKRKALLLPLCKVLTALLNKLAFHGQRKKHASVPEHGWLDHVAQFSSASSSTVFNSCSHLDEEATSHEDQHSFSSHICQACNKCNMRWQRQRCLEGSPEALGKIPVRRVLNMNEDVGEMQRRIQSCGVPVPEKIREDSLLSVAIWDLLGPSVKKEGITTELQEFLPEPYVSQILKSKRVSHKIKKMLFDCVRDSTITLPTKDDRKQGCKQFMGSLELRNLICQITKEWGQHAEDGANLSYLLTMDCLNSTIEWSKFEKHVKDISVEITDAILESMNNEIVSEMIETLAPNR